jgi:transcription elongation factor GreB
VSRAFVKEPDGEAGPERLPDLPQSPHPNHVTPRGLRRLEERQQQLQETLRLLKAGVDDMATRVERARLERDLRWVAARIECALVVDPARQSRDRVTFGATVEVAEEDGTSHEYTIVGEDEADVGRGLVSWVSPLAHALLDAAVGDEVTWRRPSGDRELTIRAIRYQD